MNQNLGNPQCVPECVPTVSPEAERAPAKRVCPSSSPPPGRDTLSEPAASVSPSVSPEPDQTPTGRVAGPACEPIETDHQEEPMSTTTEVPDYIRHALTGSPVVWMSRT